MTAHKCDLCGHYYPNREELENHIDTDHAVGLDAFGVDL